MTSVRPATTADAPAIAALSAATHALHVAALPHVFQPADPPARPVAEFEQLVEQGGPLFVVAERDGTFAGYARAELQDEPASAIKRASRTVYVHEMAVAPGHQRTGVGAALLAAVREAAARLGASAVALDVYAFNAGARAFYAREGFATLRERMIAPVEDGEADER